MDQAGVRFWPFPDSVPPEFERIVEVASLGSPAAYLAELRVIRVFPEQLDRGTAIGHIRHELAHAWDDLRNEASPRALDSLSDTHRRQAVLERSRERRPLASDSPRRLPPHNLSMAQMLALYLNRLPTREYSFANPGTAEAHAGRTVREFYAEGYSVFHGPHDTSKARLLRYAPELFGYLATEARGFGLTVPDRPALERLAAEMRYPLPRRAH
jgi:hypothetical protein